MRLAVPLALAFMAGLVVSPLAQRALPGAQAQAQAASPTQAAPLAPMVIDITAQKDADLAATPNPDLRSMALVTTDNATLAVQTGNVAKHFHARSDEIQYIVEGSGSAWLGDRRIELRPGLLIVIPKGTAHAGTVATGGRFKALAMKIPPQAAGDTTMVD